MGLVSLVVMVVVAFLGMAIGQAIVDKVFPRR